MPPTQPASYRIGIEAVAGYGPWLAIQDQVTLVRWGADCAARVLPLFEQANPADPRARRAIEAGRAWSRGGIGVADARKAAVAAHAAARECDDPAARAAARACGHAAATAHLGGHARQGAAYAIIAAAASVTPAKAAVAIAAERDWQVGHQASFLPLPSHFSLPLEADSRRC